MPMTDTMKFSVSNVPYLSPLTRPHGTPEEGMNATYNHEAMYDPRLYMDRELYAGRGVDWLLQVNLNFRSSIICPPPEPNKPPPPKQPPIELIAVNGIK
ncbi:hypothetical protein TrRE_jg3669, partial [Triparma retinervis]